MKSSKKVSKKSIAKKNLFLQGITPKGEKESCDNCFKHPCYFHVKGGEYKYIFCGNYEYNSFFINFGGDDTKKLESKGLKNVGE